MSTDTATIKIQDGPVTLKIDEKNVQVSQQENRVKVVATGTAGTRGPTGGQGEKGDKGDEGVHWQGTWNSGTTYVEDDVVYHNGASYIAINENMDSAPPSIDWHPIAAKGDTGPAGAGTSTRIEHMVAESVWIVPHGMDAYPSVTVVDSTGRIMTGRVSYLDRNTVRIEFGSAFSGAVLLN